MDNEKKHHRTTEYIDFLKYLDSNTPRKLDVHIISDNYAAHKTKEVKQFVVYHPRFKMHFSPTSSSWRLEFYTRFNKSNLRIFVGMEKNEGICICLLFSGKNGIKEEWVAMEGREDKKNLHILTTNTPNSFSYKPESNPPIIL